MSSPLLNHYVCTCGANIYCLPPCKIPCGICGNIFEVQSGITTVYKPRWVKLIQRLSKSQDIGLGATVKRIAAKFGGERFKVWSKRIGLPCACTEREVEWNRLYPNPNYVGPTNGQE